MKDLKKGGLLEGKVDPFVQAYLLPGSYKQEKTKTVKSNSNPLFNETFVYQVIRLLAKNNKKKQLYSCRYLWLM